MDALFRKGKHRASNSQSSAPAPLPSYEPHSQANASSIRPATRQSIAQAHAAPGGTGSPSGSMSNGHGGSGSAGSRGRISAPSTNPDLNDTAAPYNVVMAKRSEITMPPPATNYRSRTSTTESLLASGDAGGPSRRSPDGGAGPSGSGTNVRRTTQDSFHSLTRSKTPTSPDLAGQHPYSNGLRYQAPSVMMSLASGSPSGRSSPSPLPSAHEFGAGPRLSAHPYAAPALIYQDNDAASIRTVSSASSVQRPNDGRYPTFEMLQSRTSLSSRPAQPTPPPTRSISNVSSGSHTPNQFSTPVPTRIDEEFSFPRPPDHDIEDRFQALLRTRDIDAGTPPPGAARGSIASQAGLSTIAKTAANISIDMKWQMVESDARAKWQRDKEVRRREDELLRSGKAGKRATVSVAEKNSPQWFLKKVLDDTLTVQDLVALHTSLRTLPIRSVNLVYDSCRRLRLTGHSWLREFMECQGQVVLANYLNNITQKRGAAYDTEMELELLKCLKKAIGNKVRIFTARSHICL